MRQLNPIRRPFPRQRANSAGPSRVHARRGIRCRRTGAVNHMLNRAGQTMSELPVTAPATPGTDAIVDVPLAGVAPGDYILEVKATGEGGEAKELIGFRVVS